VDCAGILHPKSAALYLGAVVTTWLILASPASQAGVILLYHHVDASTPPITSIKPDQFERHLSIIEEEGYSVLPLQDLVERSMASDADPTEKIVAITFDDAYQSIYTEAYPRLKKRDWPFTIFVSPGYVADDHPLYLSWQQLREMADAGAGIQNHTYRHAHLIRRQADESDAMWRQRVKNDISRAATLLAERGFETSQFAYTYGEYNPALLQIVGEMNLTGFGQQSGAVGPTSDSRLLPRFPLSGVYVGAAAFRDKLRSLPMPIEFKDFDPLVGTDWQPKLTLNFLSGTTPRGLNCFGPGGAMTLTPVATGSVLVTPAQDISIGRSRYNCTYPQRTDEGIRYAWFSQLWIRKRLDGTWYPEP